MKHKPLYWLSVSYSGVTYTTGGVNNVVQMTVVSPPVAVYPPKQAKKKGKAKK